MYCIVLFFFVECDNLLINNKIIGLVFNFKMYLFTFG